MFKDILLTVDLEAESSWKKSLPIAADLAQTYGGKLHVMTVVPDFGMSMVSQYFPKDYEEKMLASVNDRLHEFVQKHVPADVNVQHIVAHGSRIYEEILNTADEINCDLIIMASHQPELRDYMLGPNAARVVRHSTRSVLVVRGD